MADKYVVLYKGRKIYHLLDEPMSERVGRTLCGIPLNFIYDTLFPGIPLNKRLCKHCERVRQNETQDGLGRMY